MSERSGNRSTLRTTLVGAAIGLAAGLFVFGLYQIPGLGNLFREWELTLYDFRLQISAKPESVSDQLVVVKIDDVTIRHFELESPDNTWPPPRWFYEELVATLDALEPAAIVFDYVFSDQRDGARYSATGDPFAEITDARPGVEYTRAAAKRFNAAGNVVFGLYAMNLAGTEEEIRETTGWNEKLVPYFERRLPRLKRKADVPKYGNQEGFQSVLRYPEGSMLVGARALGLVNQENLEGIDGITRHFQPLVEVDGLTTMDLATAALLVAAEGKPKPPEWSFAAPPPAEDWAPLPEITRTARSLTIGNRRIRLDGNGKAWIRWRGNWEKEPVLRARTRNAWELWSNRENIQLGSETPDLDRSLYKGKIVLIGFTGQGEGSDFINTPFGPQPGVYKYASILDTVMTNEFPTGLPSALDWFVAFALSSATGALVLARARASTRIAVSGTFFQVARLAAIGFVPVLGFAGLCVLAFLSKAAWIVQIVPAELATALVTVPLVVFLGIAWAQGDERKARKIAVRALGPALVKQVLSGGGELEMGGKKVPLTLFFSDIAGFTTISEKLSPEELINLLNEYLTRVSEILHDGHGATIDKYIGDAVMAFWGAPLPQADAPVKACMAAIDVMKAIDDYSEELVAQGLTPLRTRIGLNTGPAVAGGVGHVRDLDDGKFTYTAMGDTVNLASRLEGANKAYGTTCMIGPQTYEQAKHAIVARELDLVRVKGKTIPVRVFELMGRATDPLPEKRKIKERYEAALARFRKREFAEARQEFTALLTEYGDTPSKTLVASCDEMLRNPPPPEWDGSNELHEK